MTRVWFDGWMSRVEPVVIKDADVRAELIRRSRSGTVQARVATRARIVLLCAEGNTLTRIADLVGMDQHQVSLWRKRFIDKGLDGLVDEPRPGGPKRLGHDDRLRMAAIATSEKDPDDPVATWTYVDVASKMNAEGIRVSASQVWRILKGMDIDLSKVRGWLNRKDDPEFWERIRSICGLYLNPPEGALVLSVDEKCGIQALAPTHPDQLPEPGRKRRREFEYERSGTVSIMAALDTATGQILAEPIERNTAKRFIEFLETIDRTVPPNQKIVVILDNGASHTAKATRAWFENHPRWEPHFTPPHASWINQVELFFSILQRKVITNGAFANTNDLTTKIITFIAHYDQTCNPFRWTYAAEPLKAT
jgi:transposase